jgi:hypothetical protein
MSITVESTLTVMTCGKCGINFAMPEDFRAQRQKDGKGWHCPNGHGRVYKESDAEKFKRLYEKEQREAALLREKSVAAQRAQEKAEKKIKMLKKRAAAGVCPCCNRTFKQLSQHMESKHKDFMALNGMNPPKQLAEKVQ